MKLTILFSNVGNFRGDATMNFARYFKHHLSLFPADNTANLEEMITLIKKTDAGLIGLAEVDKCAHWSARIDQTRYLAERLKYPYFYCNNYFSPAPFIYCADTGNAVISRFPIADSRSCLRKFSRKNLYEKITIPFGSKKFIHTVHYLPNGRVLNVICTHLSNMFPRLRESNATELVEYFARCIIPINKDKRESYVLMADLNTVPLYSPKHGFDDNTNDGSHEENTVVDRLLERITKYVERRFPDDYREDFTLKILKDSGFFKSTMQIDPFNPEEQDDGRYKTYPQKPNRMIDYIFVSPDIQTSDVETIKVNFSDHRVIKTTVEIPD